MGLALDFIVKFVSCRWVRTSPIRAPTVTDDPGFVSRLGIGFPSHNGDNVIRVGRLGFVNEDPTFVVYNGLGVDGSRYRTGEEKEIEREREGVCEFVHTQLE